MQKYEHVRRACGGAGVQLSGTTRSRRQQPYGPGHAGAARHRQFDQCPRAIGAAAVDNDDVVKAELGGETQGRLDDADFVESRNNDGEGDRDCGNGRRCWRVNTLLRLFRLVEHEVHDDHDRGPKHHLLVPEQDLAVMKKSQRERDGGGHDSIADGGRFNGGICPHGEPAEINQEGYDVDLEAAADREKHVQKPDEHQGCSHHHADHPHLMIAA